MPQFVTVSVFLIRRLNVELKVIYRSSGLVKIEPYQCKETNLRLWLSIAQTQTVLAETKLQSNKGGNHLQSLQALFQHDGWELKEIEERVEYSL
jgi:hypothetical protein